jgi:rhodanese-related sulfurtransferase
MANTAAGLVADATAAIENLDVAGMAREVADGALVVDIREPAELEQTGTIPGAVAVPRGMLEFRADPTHALHVADFDPSRRTVVYCASGGRSALAALTLRDLGYEDVAHLAGGIQAWVADGRPTGTP